MDEVIRRNAADVSRFPWSRCILGCIPVPNTEVILLRCLHILCSDKCVDEFLSQPKPGSPLSCTTCQGPISKDDLTNKLIPGVELVEKNQFLTGTNRPICNYCIFNRPATSSCSECPAYLCGPCATLHPLMRATQKHTLQELAEPSRME